MKKYFYLKEMIKFKGNVEPPYEILIKKGETVIFSNRLSIKNDQISSKSSIINNDEAILLEDTLKKALFELHLRNHLS